MLQKGFVPEYVRVKKSVTLSGAGLNIMPLFNVTGLVHLYMFAGEITEATDSTTVSGCFIDMDSVSISEILGCDLSGCSANQFILHRAGVSGPLIVAANGDNSGFPVSAEYGSSPVGLILTGRPGGVLSFNYTGDANTDVDITFYVIYQKISDDAKILPA